HKSGHQRDQRQEHNQTACKPHLHRYPPLAYVSTGFGSKLLCERNTENHQNKVILRNLWKSEIQTAPSQMRPWSGCAQSTASTGELQAEIQKFELASCLYGLREA